MTSRSNFLLSSFIASNLAYALTHLLSPPHARLMLFIRKFLFGCFYSYEKKMQKSTSHKNVIINMQRVLLLLLLNHRFRH